MSWGKGTGEVFGGDPLTPAVDPIADVGDAPTTFDFTDEPDGAAFPGSWLLYQLATDAAGGKVASAEPAPLSFFSVSGGRALFNYTRTPIFPLPATAFTEQGLAAAPAGVLAGQNAEAACVFDPPTDLLDPQQVAFVMDVRIGFRLIEDPLSFVAGRVRADWSAGVWGTPVAVDVVLFTGGVLSVLATATYDPARDPLDIWRVQPLSFLEVKVKDGVITATLNGVLSASAGFSLGGRVDPIIFAEVHNTDGASLFPVPALAGVTARTLRDLSIPPPFEGIKGDGRIDTPLSIDTFALPMRSLIDQKLVKRLSDPGRRFVALDDISVDVDGNVVLLSKDEVVLAREDYVGQEFLSCSRDIQHVFFGDETG